MKGAQRVIALRSTFVWAGGSGSSVYPTSAHAMSENIFGPTDAVNLKSQMSACSNGKFTMEPATPTSVTLSASGVLDVTVNDDISNSSGERTTYEKAIIAAGSAGLKFSDFDLLMVFLPPGSDQFGSSDWLAFAGLGAWWSVYNSGLDSSVSTQMHEVMHNYGVKHSGEAGNEYGDQSGTMGYSYMIDEGPLMCFNGAKSYYLDWYTTEEVVFAAFGDERSLQLTGIDDDAVASFPAITVVKLPIDDDPLGAGYFIMYNKKAGVNDGTSEGANQVLIT
ncbi:hypothetical protein TeGR_g14336 [Tetraparma gracilis]|uniref:Peptidase M11 gametolysin domain-containing protein n=1 Tax=Tetraparma gracilis TaxID=2962635 RepID=A0ABQ6N5E7_9STRA|nr:hypothetical protein TeGR_g14336 [Tetraparma gracilis]